MDICLERKGRSVLDFAASRGLMNEYRKDTTARSICHPIADMCLIDPFNVLFLPAGRGRPVLSICPSRDTGKAQLIAPSALFLFPSLLPPTLASVGRKGICLFSYSSYRKCMMTKRGHDTIIINPAGGRQVDAKVRLRSQPFRLLGTVKQDQC